MPYTQPTHFAVSVAYYLITSFTCVENRAKSKSQSCPESELLATGPAADENSEKMANLGRRRQSVDHITFYCSSTELPAHPETRDIVKKITQDW